jgi:tRNA-dihydrouridine synthase B
MNDQLYMAPIMAFTDCTYREVYFRHFSGFDRAIAPFIVVSENSHYKTKSIQSLLPILHNTIPVEPQVLSKDPYAFAALCILLEEMGFPSVNINMGCPATAVVNKGRGSALLPHPDQIREFLDISFSKIKMPISIKLRSGFYSHNEIYPIIDILNAYPFSEVIIHPRLGVNKYEGPVDLDDL